MLRAIINSSVKTDTTKRRMTHMDATYKKYENLLRKLAWKYNKTTGKEYDELFSEATVGYTLAIQSFDPSKGVPLINWIARCATFRMNNYLRSQKNVEVTFFDEFMEESIPAPDTFSARENMEELFQKMSKEAREVCEIILTSPIEFGSLSGKVARGELQRLLRSKGWKHNQIWDAYKELKALFQGGEYGHNPALQGF